MIQNKINIIKCYKNPLSLHRYNFRTVNAINLLFSTLHTTPFLYGKIRLGVLHLLRASIATSDIPQGYEPVITFDRNNQIASNLSYQRRHRVVPVGIVRVVCYAVSTIFELIFPTVTQAYFITTGSRFLINSKYRVQES